jgi:hypothetical protein
MNQEDSGIKFKTTHYDYYVDKKEGLGWNVLLKPNSDNSTDMKDVTQIVISITNDGNANLQVSFKNRERITFSGSVDKYKKE